ncbi:MAG: nucleoside triphosphate pyrophosphatase [Anaerolineales bacterium]
MSRLSGQFPSDLDAPLILASASPRRRELLGLTGWAFLTASVPIDETPGPGEAPEELVQRLSLEKARAVAQARGRAREWILSADTVVADGQQALGKPKTRAQAREFLRRLRGREHRVLTGLALLEPSSGRSWTELAQSSVRMREYLDAELERYLDSGDPMDKAGAYGIQHNEFHPVADLEGCYANVMGLPLCHVQDLILKVGLRPPADLPAACAHQLGYHCTAAEAQWSDTQSLKGSMET